MTTKYHSRVTEYNGRTFASKAEAHRAQELELLQGAGKIKDLEYQPRYMLQPPFVRLGKTIPTVVSTFRAIYYVADFAYWDNETEKKVVEDVKGAETPLWKLKEKMFRYHYPSIELRVVKP
jgi:hypothetical protein